MMGCEAILFAIWGAVSSTDHATNLHNKLVVFGLTVIPLMGIGVSLICLVSIVAARRQIENIKLEYRDVRAHFDNHAHIVPKLTSSRITYLSGMFLGLGMPFIFLIMNTAASYFLHSLSHHTSEIVAPLKYP
jgi:hypothetical protein